MLIFVLPLIAVALLMLPLIPVYRGVKTGKQAKHRIIFNLCAFFGIIAIGTVLPLTGAVSAAPAEAAAAATSMGDGLKAIAAALAVGVSGIGGGIAVASSASSAIGACSEDPKSFGKSLIFVALGEGVALYGFIVSLLLILM